MQGKDKRIAKEDVDEFFRKNVEIKNKPRGYNSFVARHNNHTYKIVLFFMGRDDFKTEQSFRAGLVAIDVLSKYAACLKTIPVITATMEALQKMGKKPKIIYTDDEKAIANGEFKEYVEGEGIELYRTRGHPAFAERRIRTFKDKLFKRAEADEKKGKDNIQWVDYLTEIMLTYNNKDVNVSVDAKKQRLYPELSVGDKVKIKRKKAFTEKNAHHIFCKVNMLWKRFQKS